MLTNEGKEFSEEIEIGGATLLLAGCADRNKEVSRSSSAVKQHSEVVTMFFTMCCVMCRYTPLGSTWRPGAPDQ